MARVAKIHYYTSVLRRRSKALNLPRTKGLPEGKSPARDESTTAEALTLDAFFKVFKESTEKTGSSTLQGTSSENESVLR